MRWQLALLFCPPVPLRSDALCLPCPERKFVRVLRYLQVACEPGSRSGLVAEGDGWDVLFKKHCLVCDLCLCISTDKSVTCVAVFFLSVQTSISEGRSVGCVCVLCLSFWFSHVRGYTSDASSVCAFCERLVAYLSSTFIFICW